MAKIKKELVTDDGKFELCVLEHEKHEKEKYDRNGSLSISLHTIDWLTPDEVEAHGKWLIDMAQKMKKQYKCLQ